MANKTIYGCLDSDGSVTFADGNFCYPCNYSGCLVMEGVHIGQIKVVISEGECDDTYYGCVNGSTGKFQVEIPDNCCSSIAFFECGESGFAFCSEWGDTVPEIILINVGGIRGCDGDVIEELNGCHCLYGLNSWYVFCNDSRWEKTIPLSQQKERFTPTNVEIGDIFKLIVTGNDESTEEISFVATTEVANSVVYGLEVAWNASSNPLCTHITASATAGPTDRYVELTADEAGVGFCVEPSAVNVEGGYDSQTFTKTVITENSGIYFEGHYCRFDLSLRDSGLAISFYYPAGPGYPEEGGFVYKSARPESGDPEDGDYVPPCNYVPFYSDGGHFCPSQTYENCLLSSGPRSCADSDSEGHRYGYGGQVTMEDTSGDSLSYSNWAVSVDYVKTDTRLGSDGLPYRCILGHTSTFADKPITGVNWETYWELAGCRF